jgi:hypothetical protein
MTIEQKTSFDSRKVPQSWRDLLEFMLLTTENTPTFVLQIKNLQSKWYSSNVSDTPIGQIGIEMWWFPLRNEECLIMKKAQSDSPIWQLKKRELLIPLSLLITKPIKLDKSNLHYGPHYETQGCMIRENNITAPVTNPIKDPIKNTLVPLWTNFNADGSVRWRTSVYLDLFHWPMGKNSGNRNGVCRYVRAYSAKSSNRKPM